jgi:uncharacterized protein (DUF2235 family)
LTLSTRPNREGQQSRRWRALNQGFSNFQRGDEYR